ncbi:MAG: hypothetical protein RLZ87_55 [Armatimonadota bacterium]|jgi:hypothetical protein
MKRVETIPRHSSYFSAIDFGHIDPAEYEQRCFEQLFFRRRAFIDETFFFVETPFKRNLLKPNSLELQWLKEGLILPLVKRFEVSSFTELSGKLEAYVPHSGNLSDMQQAAEYLDEALYRSDKVQYAILTEHAVRMFDTNMEHFMLSQEPIERIGRVNQMLRTDLQALQSEWTVTKRLREDWIPAASKSAQSNGLLGMARSEIIRLACKHNNLPVTYEFPSLEQMLQSTEEGRASLSVIRWMNDIFYFSRGEAIQGETSFFKYSNNYSLGPYLQTSTLVNGDIQIVDLEVALPTMEALRLVDPYKLLALRLTQGETFLNAVSIWSSDPTSEHAGHLREQLTLYSRALLKCCEEAFAPSLAETVFKFVSGPSRSAFAAAYGFINASAVLAIPHIAPVVAVGSTVLSAPVAGYMIIRALRLKGVRKRAQVRSALGVRFDP